MPAFYRLFLTLASGVLFSYYSARYRKWRFAFMISSPFAGAVPMPGFRRRSEPEDRSRNVSAHVPGHRLPEDDAAETQTSSSGGTSGNWTRSFRVPRFSLREITARRFYIPRINVLRAVSFFFFSFFHTSRSATCITYTLL